MKLCVIGGGDKTPMISAALEQATNSNVLIVPTACSTPKSYDKKVAAVATFFQSLGITPAVLHEFGARPTQTQLAHEIGRAGMTYTIGGNSPYMLRELRGAGTDVALAAAAKENNLLLSGLSAGALLPFKYGHSCVAAKPAEEQWDYEMLEMLGLVDGAITAHANKQDPTPEGLRPDTRREALAASLPEALTGLAVDEGAGILVNGNESSVVLSNPSSMVHVLKHAPEGVTQTPIENGAHISAVMNSLIVPKF